MRALSTDACADAMLAARDAALVAGDDAGVAFPVLPEARERDDPVFAGVVAAGEGVAFRDGVVVVREGVVVVRDGVVGVGEGVGEGFVGVGDGFVVCDGVVAAVARAETAVEADAPDEPAVLAEEVEALSACASCASAESRLAWACSTATSAFWGSRSASSWPA